MKHALAVIMLMMFAAPLPSHRQGTHRTDEVIVPQGFAAMAEWYRNAEQRFAREGKLRPER